MAVDIKFCGMTRAEDVAHAVSLGAAYVGVIFAGGPRQLDPARAADVLQAARWPVRRVGVFLEQADDEIASIARDAGLGIIQLHGRVSPGRVLRLRARVRLPVWAVVRVNGPGALAAIESLDAVADGVLLDSFSPDQAGGTGTTFDWSVLDAARTPRCAVLITAGGLTPENVGAAIRSLSPAVVDVSSGVERAPGIKDHDRMRAFAAAVRHASGAP